MSHVVGCVGAGCCCGTSCDCAAYATLTVEWDGTIEFFADCVAGICVDSGSWSASATTVSGASVVVTRVEGTGNCDYVGETTIGTVTMVNCDDPGTTIVLNILVRGEVYYNTLFSRWECRLAIGIGPTALAGPYCGYGSDSWGYLDLFGYEPSSNLTYPECPLIGDYTFIGGSSCYPGSMFIYQLCTPGDGSCCSVGMPFVSAYTPGTLTVST